MSGARRHHETRWTPEQDATLRLHWGRMSERGLRALLGRTARAIYTRAYRLGLPPQSRGLASMTQAAKRLGVANATVLTLAREFGVRLEPRAPVRQHYGIPAVIHRGIDLDQFEELFSQRERRTSTQEAWCASRRRHRMAASDLFRRNGVPSGAQRRHRHRFPIAVIEELVAGGPGPWCAVWTAALAIPKAERVCAPWLLTIVAVDSLLPPVQREWIDVFAPSGVVLAARTLAEKVLGLKRAHHAVEAPGPVRCGAERRAAS